MPNGRDTESDLENLLGIWFIRLIRAGAACLVFCFGALIASAIQDHSQTAANYVGFSSLAIAALIIIVPEFIRFYRWCHDR